MLPSNSWKKKYDFCGASGHVTIPKNNGGGEPYTIQNLFNSYNMIEEKGRAYNFLFLIFLILDLIQVSISLPLGLYALWRMEEVLQMHHLSAIVKKHGPGLGNEEEMSELLSMDFQKILLSPEKENNVKKKLKITLPWFCLV